MERPRIGYPVANTPPTERAGPCPGTKGVAPGTPANGGPAPPGTPQVDFGHQEFQELKTFYGWYLIYWNIRSMNGLIYYCLRAWDIYHVGRHLVCYYLLSELWVCLWLIWNSVH